MRPAVILTTLFTTILLLAPGNTADRHAFIGLNKCIKCHGQAEMGNQYGIWLNSPHAKAALRLMGSSALEIARKHGIEKPENHRKCLRCHTTGGGRYPGLNREGVGCEACHGPAEHYSEVDIHVNFTNRERAYQRAIKHGMYPILGIRHIKNREKLCRHCHNKKRLCYPEDIKGMQRQGISLQVISEMQKGDVKLKHDLRR